MESTQIINMVNVINRDKIDMILKTARSYAILAKSMRSSYYLNKAKETLDLAYNYVNIDIQTKQAA